MLHTNKCGYHKQLLLLHLSEHRWIHHRAISKKYLHNFHSFHVSSTWLFSNIPCPASSSSEKTTPIPFLLEETRWNHHLTHTNTHGTIEVYIALPLTRAELHRLAFIIGYFYFSVLLLTGTEEYRISSTNFHSIGLCPLITIPNYCIL